GRHKVPCEIGRDAVCARRSRCGDRRVRQLGRNQMLELTSKLMETFRWQVEAEQLDGDKAIARGVVGAEHRPQRTGTDLMENSKWSERVWRRSPGDLRVQWGNSSGRRLNRNTY